MNEEKIYYKKSNRISASFLSKWTYSFARPWLAMGQKKQIKIPDLYSPEPEDESNELTNQLEIEWNKALKESPNPSFSRVIIKWYRLAIFLNSIFILISETLKIFQPLFISILLKYFSFQMDLSIAIVMGLVISISAVIGSTVHHPYYFNIGRFGMRFRVACSGLIYRKVLRMSMYNLDSKSAGDVINLLSTDVARIDFGFYYVPYLMAGPIQLIIVIIIVVLEVGPTFLAGIMVILLSYPIKAIITTSYDSFRAKNCKKSDERVSVLTEILNSIKIIKMYCWEIPFTKKVNKLRNQELKYQSILNTLQAMNATIDTIMATLVTFVNISFFIAFTNDKPLLPAYTVFTIGFYMRLCNSMCFNFTRAMIYFSNYRISANRVGKFLLSKELDPKKIMPPGDDNNVAIQIKDFNFSWAASKETVGGFSLNDINLRVNKGNFSAIVGPIGAGKTSLLMGILGELDNHTGTVTVNGKVFYICQQPWVFTSSIRQNIIFGNDYDKKKFDRVVEACSLKKDLELLPMGESTLVGEKGINLSGGQRARICMARALYSDSDVYIFDDTLSAVDGTVAKNIVKNCINGYLKDKTRVLVTHQIHHLESADQIFVMKNGNVMAQGTYNELLKSHLAALTTMNSDAEANTIEEVEDQIHADENEKEARAISNEMKAREEIIKKDREEANQIGAVGFASYYRYFTAGAGIFGLLIAILLFVAGQASVIAADYWLSLWATDEELYEKCVKENFGCDKIAGVNNASLNEYLSKDFRNKSYRIYYILCASALIVVTLRSIAFYLLCILNSKKVYHKLFSRVRDTYIRFYELNPIGRILNRFSKDTQNMDEMLVLFLYEFIQVSMTVLGALVVPSIVNPYVLIPLVPLAIIFYLIQRYFVRTGRQLKRLDNSGRSPIFIHTNSTIEGLSTIRVSGSTELMIREFHQHCDNHSRAFFAFHCCHRWFGFRLDLLCSAYTIITLFTSIFLRDVMGLGAGEVGLLIVYLFQLFDLFQWGVVLSVYVETLMTSIERIIEYTNIKSEPLYEGKRKPAANWPNKGEIEFRNVSLSYDKNMPNVLKNLTLKIYQAEKIGIVGRTGAGKSSFFQTIFRMYEPDGSIIIDDIDIKDLSLFDLRNKLTIIPQEPVLFSGTVRYNLDPYDKYSDVDIWSSLESVNLKEMVKAMSLGLQSAITSGGTNLSVGEKQLICLARAILKKTKILIIDEATANVDYKTDLIIQKTIREQFKDCTVLTIAHRLATVVDSSRILCLSEGEVKNFDTPSKLLDDESSILFELTKKLSPNEKKYIFDIAYGRTSLTDVNIDDAAKSTSDLNDNNNKPNLIKHQQRISSGRRKVNLAYTNDDNDYEYNNLDVIHL